MKKRACAICEEVLPASAAGKLCADCLTVLLVNAVADDEEEGSDEPDEGDYTTKDHESFFQYGKRVVQVKAGESWARAVRAHMDREKFWPNVWWISDHGNAHLLDMTEVEEGR